MQVPQLLQLQEHFENFGSSYSKSEYFYEKKPTKYLKGKNWDLNALNSKKSSVTHVVTVAFARTFLGSGGS